MAAFFCEYLLVPLAYVVASTTRFIQHKAEARWFYRVVSLGYDRWINPLFWTAPMRDAALALARLDEAGLEVVDVGAGTGFATEAIVRSVAPERVTMLDQSPHQLARARRKRALAGVAKVIGDAEALPFATDSCDRYVSTGSIEYGPIPSAPSPRPTASCARAASRCWPARCGARTRWRARSRTPGCSSPPRTSTSRGSSGPASSPSSACTSRPTGGTRAGIATRGHRGRQAAGGRAARAAGAGARRRGARAPATVRLARFAAGSLAGATFIPVALWFTLVRRLRRSASPLALEQRVDASLCHSPLTCSFSIRCASLRMPRRSSTRADAVLRGSSAPDDAVRP